MSPLVTSTPEPLTEDPFSDPNAGGPAPEFDAERYIAAGATEDELLRLATHYDTLSRREKRRATEWIAEASDEEFAQALDMWRDFMERADAEAALIDGTVPDVLARAENASDEGRLELAERILAAEQGKQDPDDVRTTLVEGLERIIAAERERLAQQDARTAELHALTEGSVGAVLSRVGDDQDIARRTLDAERELRGDDARSTLIAGLEKVLAAPAPTPTDGAAQSDGAAPGGTETPPSPDSPADGQQDGAGGAPEPTG